MRQEWVRALAWRVACVLCVLACVIDVAEGAPGIKKPTDRMMRKIRSRENKWTGIYILLGLMALILTPPLCIFVHSLLTDPLTPHIARELFYRARDMCFGERKRKADGADAEADRKAHNARRKHERDFHRLVLEDELERAMEREALRRQRGLGVAEG